MALESSDAKLTDNFTGDLQPIKEALPRWREGVELAPPFRVMPEINKLKNSILRM